jgi:hypothetical protein
MVLHNATGSQRRRWADDVARLTAQLVTEHGWVMWREGADVHVKHRALIEPGCPTIVMQ